MKAWHAGKGMEDMLVLVREELWKQSALDSPNIDTEQFRNNPVTISITLRGKQSEKSLTKKPKGISWQKHTDCGL